jgi:hypothetical protein
MTPSRIPTDETEIDYKHRDREDGGNPKAPARQLVECLLLPVHLVRSIAQLVPSIFHGQPPPG